MTFKALGRALCALAALILLPAQALSQTAGTTLPRGIYEPSGRQQTPVQPVAAIGRDSVTGNMCLVGVTVTCVLPGTGVGGGGGGDALASKQDEQTGVLADILDVLSAPAAGLPPPEPVTSATATLTSLYQSITASGDTTLVSATASQSTRVHRLECSILPTAGAVTVTFKSAGTTLRALDFPAVGGVLQWDYSPYWYAKTANNEALIVNFSTAGAYKCTVLYVKGV